MSAATPYTSSRRRRKRHCSSGHLVQQATQQVTRGVQHWTIPLTAAQRRQLKDHGHLLISYETTKNEVQAFDIRIASPVTVGR